MHEAYIQGTYKGEIVGTGRDKVCTLTRAVSKVLGLSGAGSAYITTRALKHVYEQRTAAEYQLILDTLHALVKRPAQVYRNKPGSKRGGFCLVGPLKEQEYICIVEIVSEKEVEIVTVFEKRERYLASGKGCVLLWSWGDGTTSHRVALDAGKPVY